jgi:inner membrane transporter RhtA
MFSILMSLEPAVAAIAGLLLLGEHLKLGQWLAVACIVAASSGAALKGKEATLPVSPESD